MNVIRETEVVEISSLKKHPENYKIHTEEQLKHIIKSVKDNGIYKNIVISEDNVILAGHGVTEALTLMGNKKVPVVRVPLHSDDAMAKKILVGDNKIGDLADIDKLLLRDLVYDIQESEELLGTGFDDQILASLNIGLESVVEEVNYDDEWQGMPEFDQPNKESFRHLIVHFKTAEDVKEFFDLVKQKDTGKTKTIWFPPVERMDTESKRYE